MNLPHAPALRTLKLNDTAISDEALERLDQFKALEVLELTNTAITGKALAHLQTLPRLGYLNLCGTQIGDRDIDALNEICSLVSVSLAGTHVTEAGLNRLQVVGSIGGQPLDLHTMACLAEMTELDFSSQPFCDVIDYLKHRHEVEIQVDPRLLTRSGVIGRLVTKKSKDVSLLRALEELVAPLGLVVVYRHDVTLIMARPLRPALCVPQLAEGQELSLQLASALSEKTELDFADQPLANVVEYLTARHNIQILIDEEAFRLANRRYDARVSGSIKGIPLRSALGLLLEPLDMTCIAEGEALVIRPADTAP